MLDSMDFHHMAERIAEGHLDSQYIPVIKNAAVVLECTPWPENLRHLATSLKSDLAKLAMSLVSKQEKDAKALSHEIHEKEHALSHEASHSHETAPGSSAAHDHHDHQH